MPTCGYICPSCGGSEHMEDSSPCTWCQPQPMLTKPKEKKETISDEEWMNSVHFGSCCSDPPTEDCKKEKEKKLTSPNTL
jgi:hypothetical protein